MDDRSPRTMTLSDGRSFAWYEFGDPGGTPCIGITGTPCSGIGQRLVDEPARRAGVRWIAVDKPGYGRSSPDPERSLARFSGDVRELLDHLGIERTAVQGESGGGPHVLALAHDLPERVTVALSVSALGPTDEPWGRDGMIRANRLMFAMADRAPVVLRLSLAAMGRSAWRSEASYTAFMLRTLPPADRAVLSGRPDVRSALFESTADGFRQGPRGAAQEFTMFSRPWHFALAHIRVPVVLWHGTEDLNVPFTVGQEVARRIPGSRLHVWDGEGHLALYAHLEEILGPVVEAGGSPNEHGVPPRSSDPGRPWFGS